MRWRKRLFDIAAAGTGLVVLSPLLLAIAAAIRWREGPPVLFRQTRIGRRGRPFQMLKFRTMTPDAEQRGGQLTVGHDPRITPLGVFLRRFKLDELPQLINVLRGEMSMVGPRPEVERYVQLYSDSQRRVLDLVPGITDPASIRYRDESAWLATASDPEAQYVQSVMPDKIDINLTYAARATVLRDVMLILRTIRLVAQAPRPDGPVPPAGLPGINIS